MCKSFIQRKAGERKRKSENRYQTKQKHDPFFSQFHFILYRFVWGIVRTLRTLVSRASLLVVELIRGSSCFSQYTGFFNELSFFSDGSKNTEAK
jgi:hypothetical protein